MKRYLYEIFTWSFLQATADTECCSAGAGAGLGGVAVSMLQGGGVAAAVRACHHCRCAEGGAMVRRNNKNLLVLRRD